jgi:RNA polymerase nonessential primary-like sigma factor
MMEAGNNGDDATPSPEKQLQVAKKGRGEKKKASTSQTSVDKLANQLGMKKERVQESIRRMQCVGNVLSLDYQYTTSTRSGYADGRKQEALMSTKFFFEDADLAERAQLKADLVAGLVRNLDERELELIRLRYGLHDGQEYTIKECAVKMGINRETARLLQHACLKKLREASNMESLQEYLLTVA